MNMSEQGKQPIRKQTPFLWAKQATERGRGRGVVLEYIMIIIIMGISMAHDP